MNEIIARFTDDHETARAANIQRGRRLEYFTIAWNCLESVIAVGSGLIAGSIALVGFGVDSLIESSSAAALLWRLRDGEKGDKREQTTLKLVGISFLLLAGYVAFNAIKSLLRREPPEASYIGIALALLSLVVMPILAWRKRRVAA